MPEILRAFGFSFLFFSREHEPVHIHIVGKGCDAKYVWNGEEFVMREQNGMNPNDLRKIKLMVDKNSRLIIRQWRLFFNKKDKYEN